MAQFCVKCMHTAQPGETVCPVCGHRHGSEEQPVFALRCGTILKGKYLVGKTIGEGGFGITYVGLDLELERKVAIKEYYPVSMGTVSRMPGSSTVIWTARQGASGREDGYASFLKEARKMAKLGSVPGVVDVQEMFTENETAYIVMTFVEGLTLQETLQKSGTMSFDRAVSLLAPIMTALADVHRKGIIHRDISPDNLKISPDGNVWLLDLGAAKDLDRMRAGTIQTSQQVAKHGFSPAEQYMASGNIGTWTDVYAMTATLYYLVTGKLPPSAMERMMEDSLKPCRPLTANQFTVIQQGMAIDYRMRLQTMEDLLRALQSVRSDAPSAAIPASTVPMSNPVPSYIPDSTVPVSAPQVNPSAVPNSTIPISRRAPDSFVPPPVPPAPASQPKQPNKLLIPLIAAAAAVVILVGAVAVLLTSGKEKPQPAASASQTETVPETRAALTEASSVPETTAAPVPETTVPETTVPVEEFVFLNELPIASKVGKVWTRSAAPVPAGYHTNSDAPGCWYDTSTPGHTSGPVTDQSGTSYTYGIHIDGGSDKARKYSITYDLGGKYKTFTGYAGCPGMGMVSHTIAPGQEKYFTIYLDGVQYFPFGSVTMTGGSVFFSYPVEGVQTLVIEYPDTSYPNEIATLFDGKLFR